MSMNSLKECVKKNAELSRDGYNLHELFLSETFQHTEDWVERDFNLKFESDEIEKAFSIASDFYYENNYLNRDCNISFDTIAVIGLISVKWNSIDEETRKKILSHSYVKNEQLSDLIDTKKIEKYVSMNEVENGCYEEEVKSSEVNYDEVVDNFVGDIFKLKSEDKIENLEEKNFKTELFRLLSIKKTQSESETIKIFQNQIEQERYQQNNVILPQFKELSTKIKNIKVKIINLKTQIESKHDKKQIETSVLGM